MIRVRGGVGLRAIICGARVGARDRSRDGDRDRDRCRCMRRRRRRVTGWIGVANNPQNMKPLQRRTDFCGRVRIILI